MMQFQKKANPKNLSIEQMWNLYRLIGKWKGNYRLVDEVLSIMKHLSSGEFLSVMHLMYDSVPVDNPAQMALMFISGLKSNNFFMFQKLVEDMNGRSKQ